MYAFVVRGRVIINADTREGSHLSWWFQRRAGQPQMSTSVFVNVYRLIPTQDRAGKASNDALEFIKMGVYHAGIEIFGQEYSFGMDPSGSKDPEKDGVFAVRPAPLSATSRRA
jgi:hypothetical protein